MCLYFLATTEERKIANGVSVVIEVVDLEASTGRRSSRSCKALINIKEKNYRVNVPFYYCKSNIPIDSIQLVYHGGTDEYFYPEVLTAHDKYWSFGFLAISIYGFLGYFGFLPKWRKKNMDTKSTR